MLLNITKIYASNPKVHEGKLIFLSYSWCHNQLVLIEHYGVERAVQDNPECVEKILKYLFLSL